MKQNNDNKQQKVEEKDLEKVNGGTHYRF